GRKLRRQGLQFLPLAALFQCIVELVGDVEMILDDRLIAPSHEDKMLDSGLACFLDDMLKDRAIDNGQHLLGDRFGGRKKPCSQTGDGKNSLANASGHQFPRRMYRASLNPLSVDVASVNCGPGAKPFPGFSKGAGERAP